MQILNECFHNGDDTYFEQNIQNRWHLSPCSPLCLLRLLLRPPPPDMYIYDITSCAHQLLACWTLSIWEAEDSKAFTKPTRSSDATQRLEGSDNKELAGGGLQGSAVACVTHPPRLISSWLFPFVTIGAHLNAPFWKLHTIVSPRGVEEKKNSLTLHLYGNLRHFLYKYSIATELVSHFKLWK